MDIRNNVCPSCGQRTLSFDSLQPADPFVKARVTCPCGYFAEWMQQGQKKVEYPCAECGTVPVPHQGEYCRDCYFRLGLDLPTYPFRTEGME